MAVRIIGAARSAIMIGPPPQRTVLFNDFHADAEGLVAAIEELLTAVWARRDGDQVRSASSAASHHYQDDVDRQRSNS